MAARERIELNVNGTPVAGEAEARTTLADFLRDELGLTGTHLGCEHGVCGACTVALDGATARSCLVLAVQARGCEVRTVEGLAAADGTLGDLQQAFQDAHALQCGFCTPGFLLAAQELLDETSGPLSDDTIREAIAGNLCRCTGYSNIVTAISRVAAERAA